MSTQMIEQTIVNRERLHRIIDAFPEKFAQKLADFMEELIEEIEEAEDITMIEARKDEPTVPGSVVIAKIEAKYGPLDRV